MKTYTAKTVEDAIKLATEELGIEEIDLVFQIIEEKNGLFSKKATICYLNRMCDKNNDCYSMFDLEKNKKIVNKYKKLLSKEVDYKKFIDLLFNVKQIEEKIGMINSYSTDEVINTAYKRYKNMYIKLKDIRKLLIDIIDSDLQEIIVEDENCA